MYIFFIVTYQATVYNHILVAAGSAGQQFVHIESSKINQLMKCYSNLFRLVFQ